MANSNITVPTVSGSVDGVVPVYNPDSRFQFWRTEDVFWGTHGTNKYVPNIGYN